jgi:hypothetical protein
MVHERQPVFFVVGNPDYRFKGIRFRTPQTPKEKQFAYGPVQKSRSLVKFLVHLIHVAASGWVFPHCLARASKSNYATLVSILLYNFGTPE